ncbi:MAG: GGDEF domain-containing protein [Thermodesulfobacteriota bacterium]
MNVTDSVTGLYCSTYFNSKLEDEYQHALRYESPLSLSLINVDNFKEITDSLGRDAVDSYMRALATLIQKTIRKVDIAACFRGEEVAIIMPHTTGECALVQAERLREKIAALKVTFELHTVHSTISTGVAALNLDAGMTADGLLDSARRALKSAKEAGVNHVLAQG